MNIAWRCRRADGTLYSPASNLRQLEAIRRHEQSHHYMGDDRLRLPHAGAGAFASIWYRRHRQGRVNLLFSLVSFGVAFFAGCEFWLMLVRMNKANFIKC
jgi:hypothetical protein